MKIRQTQSFILALKKTAKRDRGSIHEALARLEKAEDFMGKRLRYPLDDCRSIRTGSFGQLRIIYQVLPERAKLLLVGERDGYQVYLEAARLLGRSTL